eukprot:gene44562-54498_t
MPLIDVSKFTFKEFRDVAAMSDEDRSQALDNAAIEDYDVKDLRRTEPMSFFEEFVAVMIFMFGVPGSVITIPILVIALGFLTGNYIVVVSIAAGILTILFLLPAPFIESSLTSWMSVLIIKYFSYKGIYEERLPRGKPYILVAPPHGVFPYGNIATMIAYPSLAGYSMRALAASAALTLPIWKQLLGTIGAVDASRKSAEKVLTSNLTLGISTGGVAEIFDTDLSPDGDEAIVLKSRRGLVTLAMRTGAALVPCYLLGNTHLLDIYCGGKAGSPMNNFLRNISRKLGFGLILFWGRFFLPVPYRVPIVGIMAKPIEVPHTDSPSDEEVDKYHKILMDEMVKLFDKHKA